MVAEEVLGRRVAARGAEPKGVASVAEALLVAAKVVQWSRLAR